MFHCHDWLDSQKKLNGKSWHGGERHLELVSWGVLQSQIAKPGVSSDAGSRTLNVGSRYSCILIWLLLTAMRKWWSKGRILGDLSPASQKTSDVSCLYFCLTRIQGEDISIYRSPLVFLITNAQKQEEIEHPKKRKHTERKYREPKNEESAHPEQTTSTNRTKS